MQARLQVQLYLLFGRQTKLILHERSLFCVICHRNDYTVSVFVVVLR